MEGVTSYLEGEEPNHMWNGRHRRDNLVIISIRETGLSRSLLFRFERKQMAFCSDSRVLKLKESTHQAPAVAEKCASLRDGAGRALAQAALS